MIQPAPETIVALDAVTLSRGTRAVLDRLTFNVTEARVGLIGRNGSGKSTLIRAIAGLAVPDAGQIRVCGADIARDRAAALRLVGLLFQNPDHQIIFPTVIEELAFGLRQQGRADPDAEAQAMLARFGRADWADRPISELSQGQRHLVCILAILAMEPRVILLDEPMAGLDLPTIRGVQALLDGLSQNLIHATHDLSLLTQYDRILWIEGGRLAADGPPADVLPAYSRAMEEDHDAFADIPH